MRRVLFMTVVGAVALIGTMLPASAADDGYTYRLTSGNVLCSVDSIGLGNPASIDVNYPAGAPVSVTLAAQVDTGSGFGAPIDVSFALLPAGATGTVQNTFFGIAPNADPPATVRIRWTLNVNGTPTYQQTVDATCPVDIVDTPGAGTVQFISEDLFATADPPAGGAATALETQPRTTG